jgi:hypothetical protein
MESSNSWGLTKNLVKWLHWHGQFWYARVAGRATKSEGGPADLDGAKQDVRGQIQQRFRLDSLNSEDL